MPNSLVPHQPDSGDLVFSASAPDHVQHSNDNQAPHPLDNVEHLPVTRLAEHASVTSRRGKEHIPQIGGVNRGVHVTAGTVHDDLLSPSGRAFDRLSTR